MTIYNLIENHKKNFPESHYFDYDTLRFFGERISDMRILKKTAIVNDWSGKPHECFVLSKSSKNCYGKYHRNYDYFDIATYERIITD